MHVLRVRKIVRVRYRNDVLTDCRRKQTLKRLICTEKGQYSPPFPDTVSIGSLHETTVYVQVMS